MEKEQFIKEFLEKIRNRDGMNIAEDGIRYYEDGYTSDDPKQLLFVRETNIKYSKTESDKLIGDFIVITFDNAYSQSCRLECESMYRSFLDRGWDYIWSVVDDNVALSKKIKASGIMELLSENDYNALKDKLFIRPLNYQDHRFEMKDAVYRRIGDIVLVLYFLAEDVNIGEHHNVSSMRIHLSQAEKWDVPEDQVWDAAMTNTYLMAPPRMYLNPFDTYKPAYHKGAFMALGSDMKKLNPFDMPTLTTTSQMNGAIACFYPGVKERIAEMFGDDYYVAFTSIHECKLHKKGTISPRIILDNVKDINKAFNPTEILSRKVYLFEKNSGQFKQLEL